MDELARRRAEQSRDSTKWSPVDALEDLLERIREGKENPDCLMITWFEKNADGEDEHHYQAANLTRQKTVALLHISLARATREWIK